MTEQWQELKETIIELRDNNGAGTQQEVCKFLANYMDTLEKQITDEWIPVSERLPKENDTYEVTLRGISELEGITEIAYATWLNNDWLYHDVDDWQYKEVIAWKTRTQPYKVESDKESEE